VHQGGNYQPHSQTILNNVF